MFILRLDPPLPLETPKGPAFAVIFRDYGLEHDDVWTCLHEDGQIWTWGNAQVRALKNITLGRLNPERP